MRKKAKFVLFRACAELSCLDAHSRRHLEWALSVLDLLMQASPYYTTDMEAASVVYVYDYCIQSWQTAAAFAGNF